MFPDAQTMNININGGRGGTGGEGHGSGTGGAGGQGMGANVNFDIRPGRNFTVNNNVRKGESGIDILHHIVALEAIHDSAESFPQPKCHRETRTRMLQDLREWVLASRPETTVLWLHGPAGAGKSAIMQTLAGQLQGFERLGASFFFKRSHATRGNGKKLFATIAYQLALSVPWLRDSISQTVENDPSIVGRSMEAQVHQLIAKPCLSHEYHDPVAILIDGLDECEEHGTQQEILRIIHDSLSRHPIPLRVIVASRPEPHIREVFNSPAHNYIYRSFNVEQSFVDVRKYLRDEFSRIHREHLTMARIPFPWPTPDVLEKLVQNSSGYFVYVSTIIKFIDDKSYRPTERLAVVQDPNSSGSKSAFDTLDQLYKTILSSAPRQSEIIPILCAIFDFELAVPYHIDQYFGLADGETQLLLRGLNSVIDVPFSATGGISSHHASFGDFLKNPDRSSNFCVSTLNRRISLARSFLQFCAGPFQREHVSLLSRLIRFIVLLPPSGAVVELFPLIGSIDPDYIFHPEEYRSREAQFEEIITWLKNNPSAPSDVILLWEEYTFMVSIDSIHGNTRGPSVEHIISPSPELLRILVGLVRWYLPKLRTRLDLTWSDLRSTLCSLQPKFLPDEYVLIHQPDTVYPWAARDLALQLIRKMVKNHIDTDGGVNPSASRDAVSQYNGKPYFPNLEQAHIESQHDLASDISYFVRLSPPCPALYRELWSIPPSEIWSSWPSGNKLIHNVSEWLESFPDSTMELITFWQQAVPDDNHYRGSIYDPGPDFWEQDWFDRATSYNSIIEKLHLPDSLKFPL
ncbi:hypothetical protein C8R45DRAFT_1218108 [Mycena sanguinolenta]|nr:hypothetical protein C8R45DRAFT_1218108 [Mycena sanguinolenta]